MFFLLFQNASLLQQFLSIFLHYIFLPAYLLAGFRTAYLLFDFFHLVLNIYSDIIEIWLYLFHLRIDSISEFLEPFTPSFGLLMHLFFENQSSFHFMQQNLFLIDLIMFLLPLLFLLIKILDFSNIRCHFILQLNQFILFPKISTAMYMMKARDSSSFSLFFFSNIFPKF